MPDRRIPAGERPQRPLTGGLNVVWKPEQPAVRVYHRDGRSPDAVQKRTYGPLFRFDPHPSAAQAAAGGQRAVVYLGEAFLTGLYEVLGRAGADVALCPMWHAAFVHPHRGNPSLQDIVAQSPTKLGAPDDLGDGDWHYTDTQEWARAIYEDRPADPRVGGIRYWSRRHRDQGGQRLGVNRVAWDTAGPFEVVQGTQVDTRPQEFPLHSRALWPTVLDVALNLGMAARRIDGDRCERCQVQRP